MKFPRLETERLILRELSLDDATDVQRHFADPHVTEYMDIEPCADLDSAREIISFHLRDAGVRWGVFDRSSERLIGTCGFHCWDEEAARAEIGYDLAKEHWDNGLMKEAVVASLRFAFDSMGLATVLAGVHPKNARSIGLLVRLGFELECSTPNEDGSIVFEIAASEFRRRFESDATLT